MEDLPKLFIEIGTHLININAIAYVAERRDGGLRITTLAVRKGGFSQSFIVPKGEHLEEFKRQIAPYIAVHAAGVPVEEGGSD